MSNLIIVESPTKAKTLNRFLGKDYVVEATMGHIKDLPKSQLGVDIENDFQPDYKVVTKRGDVIKKIQKLAKEAKAVYLATDPDREGEAISAHVRELLAEKKITKPLARITFHEITQQAVEEAIAHPGQVDQDLVDAQTARRVLDRLVGYKLSPLLWKKVRRGLSAGRVQSVAVRLVVEREREIAAFKPEEYWEIYCTVTPMDDKPEFTIALVKISDKKAAIKNQTDADKIVTDLKAGDYKVNDVKKRLVTKNPYPPFTTSTMTQGAARLFGWSAKKTMQAAQKLYEEGLITYHRTDSMNLSAQAVSRAREYIAKEYGQNYLPEGPRFYKTKSKSAQEAHEAVRPTQVAQVTAEGMANDEQKLYNLIRLRFLACQMASATYDETTIDVTSGKYLLRASGQIMKFDGWRKVMPTKLTEEGVVELPNVKVGEDLNLVKVDPLQKFTQPPARYNEASLIKTLEKLGIGRPSTYAPTISTIQVRNYVEKEEGKFFATTIGMAVTDFLIANFPKVFDYDFTAQMEQGLDEVADGKRKWVKELKDFWGPFTKILEKTEKAERVKIETETTGRKCPTCNEGDLIIRHGRFGKFISCSRFPDCKHTEKLVTKVENMKCPDCGEGEVVLKRTKRGRKFYGCSRYPDCKFASWKKPQTSN